MFEGNAAPSSDCAPETSLAIPNSDPSKFCRMIDPSRPNTLRIINTCSMAMSTVCFIFLFNGGTIVGCASELPKRRSARLLTATLPSPSQRSPAQDNKLKCQPLPASRAPLCQSTASQIGQSRSLVNIHTLPLLYLRSLSSMTSIDDGSSQSLRRFMLYRKVPRNISQRASSPARGAQAGESRPFKRNLAVETLPFLLNQISRSRASVCPY